MTASVLTIGDELLIGKIVNTNSTYISRRLSENGLVCTLQMACADSEIEIVSALNLLAQKSDLIIVTGGLGVTKDDLTKKVIAKYVDTELVISEEATINTNRYYSEREIEVCQNVEDFYTVPKDSILLKNSVGVAQGFVVNHNKKKIAVFPGPQSELIPMFENEFLPILESWNSNAQTIKYFKIFGLRELEVVEKIRDLYRYEDNGIFLTTYCGVRDVALVMRYGNKVSLELADDVIFEITKRFGRNLYSFANEELEKTLFTVLDTKHSTIAVAESVTGGLICSKLVSVPGISKYLIESLVTYSEGSKIARLGVSIDTLLEYGAVSEQTAIEMCKGLLLNKQTQYAVATTGFAGPCNGENDENVGLCYIAIGNQNEVKAYKHKFIGTRDAVRESCAKQAIYYLINLIKYSEF